MKTDEGTINDVYVYEETTLEQYFNLIDPNMEYWHNSGSFLLDNYDGEMRIKAFALYDFDTIYLERRADHPWWSAPTTESNVYVCDDRTDTWTHWHGNWGTLHQLL